MVLWPMSYMRKLHAVINEFLLHANSLKRIILLSGMRDVYHVSVR